MVKTQKDLDNLLKKFNQLDKEPTDTEDLISTLEKSISKEPIKSINNQSTEKYLTEEDLEQLRLAREQEVALKRGLITAQQFIKPSREISKISKIGKLHSSLKSSVDLSKNNKQKAKETSSLIEEFQLKTQVLGKVKDSSKTLYKSGIDTLGLKKSVGEPLAEGFEYNFLIDTKGRLNKDELLSILISTWDTYTTNKINDDKNEELTKEVTSGSGNGENDTSLLGIAGVIFAVKTFWKYFKKFVKDIRGIPKVIAKNTKALIKKFNDRIIKPISKVFKRVITKLKKWGLDILRWAKGPLKALSRGVSKGLEKLVLKSKTLGNKVYNMGKNLYKGTKEVTKTAIKKGVSKLAKTSAGKYISKKASNLAVKKGLKASTKATLKNLAKGAGKVSGGLVDIAFFESDIRDIMKEYNVSREQAYDIFLKQIEEEGFTWTDVIDPFTLGQKIAVKTGIAESGRQIGEITGASLAWFSNKLNNKSVTPEQVAAWGQYRKEQERYAETQKLIALDRAPVPPKDLLLTNLREPPQSRVITGDENNFTPSAPAWDKSLSSPADGNYYPLPGILYSEGM